MDSLERAILDHTERVSRLVAQAYTRGYNEGCRVTLTGVLVLLEHQPATEAGIVRVMDEVKKDVDKLPPQV